MAQTIIQKQLSGEADTVALAQQIAPLLGAGNTLLLSGDIGSGKSVFARGVIRARLGQGQEVPSPTFTIVQTYHDADVDIWHCDLYRISDAFEAVELGLIEAFETAICLIEWPQALGDDAPKDALSLHFQASRTNHLVAIAGNAVWASRLGHLYD